MLRSLSSPAVGKSGNLFPFKRLQKKRKKVTISIQYQEDLIVQSIKGFGSTDLHLNTLHHLR